jgi:hypothetical protein
MLVFLLGTLSEVISSASDENDTDFQAKEESDETGSNISLSPTLDDRTTPPRQIHQTSLLANVDSIPSEQWTEWTVLDQDVTPSLMCYRNVLGTLVSIVILLLKQ